MTVTSFQTKMVQIPYLYVSLYKGVPPGGMIERSSHGDKTDQDDQCNNDGDDDDGIMMVMVMMRGVGDGKNMTIMVMNYSKIGIIQMMRKMTKMRIMVAMVMIMMMMKKRQMRIMIIMLQMIITMRRI